MDSLAPYTYYGLVKKVYDGDTATLDLDLGLNEWRHNVRVRLAGCNAIELHEPGGAEARAALLAYLPIGAKVLLKSLSFDKYNRIDAVIWEIDHAGQPLPGGNIIEQLIAKGFLAHWDGRGPRPLPAWPIPTTATV